MIFYWGVHVLMCFNEGTTTAGGGDETHGYEVNALLLSPENSHTI